MKYKTKYIHLAHSFFFCENHTIQNLAQMMQLLFITIFSPILNNKWHNFWYLKFLFQLNMLIG